MTDDYRNTQYDVDRSCIEKNKQALRNEMMKVHPRAKNHYLLVKNHKDPFHNRFRRVYGDKCAYCGVSTDIDYNFEIDHYICKSSFKEGDENPDDISNLVFSCKRCNRNKSDVVIFGQYKKWLNPDNGNIATVFYRDDEFYIRIREEYSDDTFIRKFYAQLKLGEQIKRLDYLLLLLTGMIDGDRYCTKRGKLLEAKDLLMKRRNHMMA